MSLPTISFLLPSQRGIKDASTGMWSYMDVFESITIPEGLEFTVNDFHIGGKINNVTKGPVEVIVKVLNPDNKTHTEVPMAGEVVQDGDMSINAIFRNIQFTVPGRYLIKVYFKGKVLPDQDRHYFEVKR